MDWGILPVIHMDTSWSVFPCVIAMRPLTQICCITNCSINYYFELSFAPVGDPGIEVEDGVLVMRPTSGSETIEQTPDVDITHSKHLSTKISLYSQSKTTNVSRSFSDEEHHQADSLF